MPLIDKFIVQIVIKSKCFLFIIEESVQQI